MDVQKNIYLCIKQTNNTMKYRTIVTIIALMFVLLRLTANINVNTRFLNADNGLGTNNVRGMVQDSRGYVWIASVDGLIRYDGYKAMILKPGETPRRRLMYDFRIQDLRLLNDRYLLLRLRGNRYSCYDISTDCFIEYDGNYKKVFGRKKNVKRPAGIPAEAQLEIDNRGNTIGWTPQGDIWHVDNKTKSITYIGGVYNESLVRLNGNPRYAVLTDRDGQIWVSTFGNGLFVHDPKTGETTHLQSSTEMTTPIETDYLTGIYEDRSGNIWVSQENMGVAIITKRVDTVEKIYFTTEADNGHANSIHLLKRIGDTVYIGNRYNGLKKTDSRMTNMALADSHGDDIVAICQGKDGAIWMGTRKSGIYCDDRHYCHDKSNPSSLSNGKISDILCDRKGRIWVSLFNGGVDMAEPDGKGGFMFRHFFSDGNVVRQPRQMCVDHRGYIWLSASNGLYLFDPEKLINNPKAYKHLNINKNNPQLDEIHCIYEDSQKRMLAGTQGCGLVVMDNGGAGTPTVKCILTTKDGLPSNSIQQLTEDGEGNIWIGTDNGLACYKKGTEIIVTLFPSAGRQSNMFVENAVCKLADGRLAFGSRHGITIVDPTNLPTHQSLFKLCITDLDINGISAGELKDYNIASLLNQTEPIRLAYNQNSLTFYFSDFGYAGKQQSRYLYRLEGYDSDWSVLSSVNFASYKNLPPGKYVMSVRSLNADGRWNDVTTHQVVIISPPLWRTWWAYLLYIALLAAAVSSVWQYFKRTNDLKTRIRVQTQLTEYKLRFFTNISHEFRTPLTIIRGAMERIADVGDIPGNLKQPVSSMQKSVDRMMRLINQLLEFRKMQNDKLQLALQETDVIGFVKNIFLTFMQMAENKHINYTFTPFAREYTMFIDKNYVDNIVYNLLSNSFKYTTTRHSIMLRITHDQQAKQIAIIVEDTGIGIPKDKQADLFSRFNQSVYTADSIGIGLHLVHELVRVHHGSIEFRENPEGGAIFTVTLPTDRNCYDDRDFLVETGGLLKEQKETMPVPQLTDYREMITEPLNDRRVLIVEDDDNVLEYMQNALSHYFIVDTATNGQEALDQLTDEGGKLPDLIVSDVMMPIMNGIELTRRMRAIKDTADIPIILLTALTAEEKKVSGIDSGADAYIEKPFSVKMLIATCRSLITKRDSMRAKYAREVANSDPVADIIIDTQDQRMRKHLDSWIMSHYSDPQLDIDKFAESMQYGRTTFYRKVKQLTGYTPNDYIKHFRMNKALELLRDDTLSISQVSYMIGIDDPYYFSRSFKKHFGLTPSQYRKGERPKTDEH